MKQHAILVGALLAFFTIVGSIFALTVGTQNGSRAPAAVLTALDEPIAIGAILPLSGNLAKVGEDVRVALEIAREDLMARYPHVTLVYEDDAFNPKNSVDAFNKLVTVDNVDAIIGPLNGASISAIRPLAAERRIVAFTPWGAGNRIEDFTIKNSVEADDEARTIAEYAVGTLGLKKLAIVYLNNDFGILHYDAFRTRVEELGAELVAEESFEVAENDFRTQLSKVKAASADGLYIVHNGARVGIIAKQAHELGIVARLFGQYATESSDLIASGGTTLEGLVYTFPIDEAHLTEAQKEFVTKFEARVGGKPQVAAYNAYDIYTILVPAIVKCKKNSECMRNEILSESGFSGVGGTVSFESGRLVREFYLKTIKNGALIPVE